MSNFTKMVRGSDLGSVVAAIYDCDGERVAFNHYSGPSIFKDTPEKLQARFDRANLWADRLLAVYEKNMDGFISKKMFTPKDPLTRPCKGV